MPQQEDFSSTSAFVELQNFSLFHGMTLAEIKDLCANGKVIVANHRQQLFTFGAPADSFGVVLSGAFKLSRPTAQGEEAIFHFSAQGDAIGALIMSQENPKYPVTATAMGPSRFLSLPRATYVQSWKNNPELVSRVQSLLSTRMAVLHDQKAMQRSPLSAKVAALLMSLAAKASKSNSSQSDANELIVSVPLTRQEIADSLGTTVESVIRIMSQWSKQGLVTTADKQIRILDPGELTTYANAEKI